MWPTFVGKKNQFVLYSEKKEIMGLGTIFLTLFGIQANVSAIVVMDRLQNETLVSDALFCCAWISYIIFVVGLILIMLACFGRAYTKSWK